MKLLNIIITVFVAITMIAALVVPVIDSEADSVTTTYSNGSTTLAQQLETTPAAHTIEYTSGSTFSVDGVAYELGSYARLGIFASDNCSVQLASAYSQIYIMQASTSQITSNLSDGFKIVTDTSGNVTITYGTTTITKTYTWSVILNSDGKYVWDAISSITPRYIYNTSDILVAYSFASGNNYCTYVNGVAKINGTDAEFTATTADVENTDGTVKTVSALAFGSFTIAFGYVPITVSYIDESSSHMLSLLYVIPTVLIASLIMIIARGMILNKAD